MHSTNFWMFFHGHPRIVLKFGTVVKHGTTKMREFFFGISHVVFEIWPRENWKKLVFGLSRRLLSDHNSGSTKHRKLFSIFSRSYLRNYTTYLTKNPHTLFSNQVLQPCQISKQSEGVRGKHLLNWHGMTQYCLLSGENEKRNRIQEHLHLSGICWVANSIWWSQK